MPEPKEKGAALPIDDKSKKPAGDQKPADKDGKDNMFLPLDQPSNELTELSPVLSSRRLRGSVERLGTIRRRADRHDQRSSDASTKAATSRMKMPIAASKILTAPLLGVASLTLLAASAVHAARSAAPPAMPAIDTALRGSR